MERVLTKENMNDVGARPGVQEKEATAPCFNKKRFPWLPVIMGAGAAAALVVLLARGKKQAAKNSVLTVKGVNYELVQVPAGEFRMGSNSSLAQVDEKPVHAVRLTKGFWMGRTEVTQGLWQAVMGSNPSFFNKGSGYPVERVSWDDCQGFIRALNRMLGGNAYRLPTEAEWEYACRAGTTADRYGDLDAIAWYDGNSIVYGTQPTGQKKANSWGLHDMLGNVWEWCQDWYDESYYQKSPGVDPPGPSSGTCRVNRGCSWNDAPGDVRGPRRLCDDPHVRYFDRGFRLVRDLK